MRPLPTTATNGYGETSLHEHPSSPWHSPVPYLFGGLAAMLGLIAFALLILACSYWKLTGFSRQSDPRNSDPNQGKEDSVKPSSHPMEMKVVVIMAGDDKPTYLATPISSKASNCFLDDGNAENKEAEKQDDGNQETHDQGRVNDGSHESN